MSEQNTNALDVNKFAEDAAVVAALAEDYAQAIRDERAAEAAVLDSVIASVKPALRALSSRMISSSYETSGRNGCNPVSRTEYHAPRGFVLVDDYDRDRDETGNRGQLGGTRLVVLTDGSLAVLERTGHFSHWQGEADTWESTLTPVTAVEAMDVYKLDDCLSSIRTGLDKQLAGNASTASLSARERTDKLRAVTALLKK